MVQSLMSTLMEGQKSVGTVTGDTKIFGDKEMGRAPTGENTWNALSGKIQSTKNAQMVVKANALKRSSQTQLMMDRLTNV